MSTNNEQIDLPDMMNLHQRMLAITGDCQKRKADAKVAAGKLNYDYTSHNAVTELIQPLLVKHGVDAMPCLRSVERAQITERGYDGKEITKNRITVFFDILFFNVDDPEDQEAVSWFADAMGNSDKILGIAVSAGIRQCYQKRFKLRTGDPDLEESDNEDKKDKRKNKRFIKPEKEVEEKRKNSEGEPFDAKTHNRKLLSPGRITLFNALVQKYDWHSLELIEQVFSGYGVDTTEELFDSDWIKIKNILEKGPQMTDIPF